MTLTPTQELSFHSLARPFSRLAASDSSALPCLATLTDVIPLYISPLFVSPSVFSSQLLFKPQLQGSVFLPSICLVTCPQPKEPAASRVPPVRLCQLNPQHWEHCWAQGCIMHDLESTKPISTNRQQLQVI